MEEIWKPIKDYVGLYEVSNLGNVRSLPKMCGFRKDKGRIVKPFTNNNGYKLVSLSKDKKMKHFQVHRLVANEFIDNPDNKQQVDHINRNRSDNRVENLRWVSASENGNNTKLNRFIHYNGETKTLTEWSRILGIKQVTLHQRVFISKWSIEKAFTQPVMEKKRGNKNGKSNYQTRR